MATPGEVDKFYEDADRYWSDVPATLDGMMGGYTHIVNTDIDGSIQFILPFIEGKNATVTPHRACDCGAGIGRVSKNLLLPLFDTVDLVELNPAFVEQAKKDLKDRSVEKYICCGLQNFTPEPGRYDVIWAQWVLGHLTDKDLVSFFQRCQKGLSDTGVIMIKENTAFSDECDFDEQDSSYTRPQWLMEKLIVQAGLKIIQKQKQHSFPHDIYAVWMYAIK